MSSEQPETGYHDRHGIPIYVGDLIRVPHYRHVRGKRQMWLYFRVAVRGDVPVAEQWYDKTDAYQCLLTGIEPEQQAEVVAENGLFLDANGHIMTFNERPRRKESK